MKWALDHTTIAHSIRIYLVHHSGAKTMRTMGTIMMPQHTSLQPAMKQSSYNQITQLNHTTNNLNVQI